MKLFDFLRKRTSMKNKSTQILFRKRKGREALKTLSTVISQTRREGGFGEVNLGIDVMDMLLLN